MVLLNRRGYARTLLCRGCGHVYTCPDCSVSMTYHQQENRLACHYCGQEKQVPSACVSCGGPYIHYAGIGTEQARRVIPRGPVFIWDAESRPHEDGGAGGLLYLVEAKATLSGCASRVAGFTQYWVEIGKPVQDELIARTEYEGV